MNHSCSCNFEKASTDVSGQNIWEIWKVSRFQGTYLGCWLVGHFSPGLKPRRINQVSVVNNFHSIYWIWIWIDWFKSQDLEIDVSKDVQAKTHSSFWPLQRKARIFCNLKCILNLALSLQKMLLLNLLICHTGLI